jgi:hypothetical protein
LTCEHELGYGSLKRDRRKNGPMKIAQYYKNDRLRVGQIEKDKGKVGENKVSYGKEAKKSS